VKLHSDFTATMYAIPERGDSASEEHLAGGSPVWSGTGIGAGAVVVPQTMPMPLLRSCGLPGRPSVHDGRNDAVVTPEDQVVQVG